MKTVSKSIILCIALTVSVIACATLPEKDTTATNTGPDIESTIAAKLLLLEQELQNQAQAPTQPLAEAIPTSIPIKTTGKIDVLVEPVGGGSVSSSIMFSEDGTPIATYTASAASGYVFDSWTGDFAPSLIDIWANDSIAGDKRTSPMGLASDISGNMYIVDSGNHRIQVYDGTGSYVFGWGGEGSGPGQFQNPTDIVIGIEGNIFISDTGNKRIQVFNQVGAYISSIGDPNVDAIKFTKPAGIAVDGFGFLYVIDEGNGSISKFDTSGTTAAIKLSMKQDKSITAKFLTEAEANKKAMDEAGIIPTPIPSPTQTPWIKYIKVTPKPAGSTATPIVACGTQPAAVICTCVSGAWGNCRAR
jgi:hypothetical protein